MCCSVCYCDLALAKPELTKESTVLSSDEESTAGNTWVSTLLYTLMMDKGDVLLPTGWLLDTFIKAAQLRILQKFPHVAGLQDPRVGIKGERETGNGKYGNAEMWK